jgi:hypothetical protein
MLPKSERTSRGAGGRALDLSSCIHWSERRVRTARFSIGRTCPQQSCFSALLSCCDTKALRDDWLVQESALRRYDRAVKVSAAFKFAEATTKFKKIASRLTGFGVPVFGISSNPPEPEIAVARRVLTFLEARRVLFNPYHLEIADQCISSVVEIRRLLTEELWRLPGDSKLADHLRGIRAGCRKFLDDMRPGSRRIQRSHWPGPVEPEFFTELGELRATIGFRIAATL